MAKLRLVIELEYDAEMMHGGDADAEARRWFMEDVLMGSCLSLNDNGDLGDQIGSVKVLKVEEIA